MSASNHAPTMRALVAAALGVAAGIFAFAAAAAFVGTSLAAAPFAAFATAVVGGLAYKRPIVPLEERAVRVADVHEVDGPLDLGESERAAARGAR